MLLLQKMDKVLLQKMLVRYLKKYPSQWICWGSLGKLLGEGTGREKRGGQDKQTAYLQNHSGF